MKPFVLPLLVALAFNLSAQEETLVPITLLEDTVQVGDDPIFTIVQESPKFPGGETEMFNFIAQNVYYPREAKDKDIQGVVFVQFIINKDGCIDTFAIEVLRGVDPSLDNEAIRVVKEMPCWTPGYQNGKPVRVYYKLPFRFTLKK